MADPFEVRMRFTNLLSHLSASATASIKTAHYALKHRDMDEDLHSCILENLERGHNSNMNNKANIMYFLEHHADLNLKEGGHAAYIEMVKRDILRIIDAVAQSGANVKVVRRVVTGLGEKGVLSADTITSIETGLKDKEERLGKLLGDEAEAGADEDATEAATADGPAPEGSQKATPRTGAERSGKPNGVSKIDKRAIEQRIEEDRERNKRLRESVWTVSGDDDQELDMMWEDGATLGEDEHDIADEEAEERLQFVSYHRATMGV
ncbi:hypothetical protein G647_00543 [Cladophialophora carrionii CBS 160.54]|uniref:CID domain-containing protein n=1 Tax=Cladophialophora carrionii CBS 160.54 TaxID=1279043 RepID=V9DMG0_9EURO|nr:uncharacterized protein G647_00543 [Cladophialophora carrionii CBS 160.54]ETI28094.1 hypothetical protein G647_00543 [Cladophialophora carrionii CBS 160.54]